MTDTITITTDKNTSMDKLVTIDEKKVSIIRKYPLESLIYLLIGAVGFITWWQFQTAQKVDDLQKEVKTYLHEDRSKLIQAMDNNTDVMEKVIIYLSK